MSPYALEQLFEAYVHYRQQNIAPQAALQRLAQMQPQLPEADRYRLARWLRSWESDPTFTPPMQQATPGGMPCPSCGTPNPQESKYCYACGVLLSGGQMGKTSQLMDEEYEDASTFGPLSTLMILAKGYEHNPLRLQIQNKTLVIGRAEDSGAGQVQIDLSPYGARDMGVSRQHAMLQRSEKSITLVDRGSVNHTFINGERLHSNEVRVVRDGDEIRFGRLVTRFIFQRELRRI